MSLLERLLYSEEVATYVNNMALFSRRPFTYSDDQQQLCKVPNNTRSYNVTSDRDTLLHAFSVDGHIGNKMDLALLTT